MTISDYLRRNFITHLHHKRIYVFVKNPEEFLVIISLLESLDILNGGYSPDVRIFSLPIYPRYVLFRFLMHEKKFKYQYTVNVRDYHLNDILEKDVLKHNFHEFIMSAWLIPKILT